MMDSQKHLIGGTQSPGEVNPETQSPDRAEPAKTFLANLTGSALRMTEPNRG